jgi:putative membrane protein insertion efficiency factor
VTVARLANHAGAAIESIGRSGAIVLIALYKQLVSPLLAAAIGPACRFEPTCSEYASQIIAAHGVRRGGWMAIRRLARCRPGGGWGYDPALRIDSRE